MDIQQLRGKYAQKTPIYVKQHDEMEHIFDEWAYQSNVQNKDLPEPLIYVCDVPGQNSEYMLDTPFYTLQSDSLELLSSPLAVSTGVVKDGAFTKDIFCAWVAYLSEEIQEVFSFLAYARAYFGKRVPSNFCTGIMQRGTSGIVCSKLTLLSPADMKRIKKEEEQQARADNAVTRVITAQTKIDWSVAPSRLKKKRGRRHGSTLPPIDFKEDFQEDFQVDSKKSEGAEKEPVQDVLAKLSERIGQGKSVPTRHGTRKRGNIGLPALPL